MWTWSGIRNWLVALAVCETCVALPAVGEVLRVQADRQGEYPSIQAALDAANDGDVIELADGIFVGPGNRSLRSVDKTFTLRSASNDPTRCVIDCEGSEINPRDAIHVSAEGRVVMQGITIRNGYADNLQVFVLEGADFTIENCAFTDFVGRGFFFYLADVTIRDCLFSRIRVKKRSLGPAVLFGKSSVTIDRTEFRDNETDWIHGVVDISESEAVISESSFARNASGGLIVGGHILALRDCEFQQNRGGVGTVHGDVDECTFVGNVSVNGGLNS